MKINKIVCVHLFNDFSGSPLVLANAIKGFREDNITVDLHTSGSGEGFLSNLDVNYHFFNYHFYQNKILRSIALLWSQLILIFKLLRYRNQDVIIYANTLLPFGAAIAARMMGKKLIYHIHETSVKPAFLKAFLKFIASKTASLSVFVSKFVKEEEEMDNVPSVVVYNSLDSKFVHTAQAQSIKKEAFTILMLCSLKDYKGVKEFVSLSKQLPSHNFELVLNAKQEDIDDYFSNSELSHNLKLFPRQSNVHPFYKRASLVLNLSHPEEWMETFGMTLLEGMVYGLPSIAPPVGGPAEIVQDDVNGYTIDQRALNEIATKIDEIANNESLYKRLSDNAKKRAFDFENTKLKAQLIQAVQGI